MRRNKGFSMVELIIVIAIMAILVGVIAPMLIKYINKSRLSADIDTGKTIATAISTTITDDAARDNAVEHATPQLLDDMDGSDFKDAVYKEVGLSGDIVGKSSKDADGDPITTQKFYYTLDAAKNKVEVFYGGITADYQIYPKTGSKLVK